MKYHTFIDNTIGNNFPLIYGTTPEIKKGISMTKFFKSKGFIHLAATHNSCNREIFDWENTSSYIILDGIMKIFHYFAIQIFTKIL